MLQQLGAYGQYGLLLFLTGQRQMTLDRDDFRCIRLR